VGPVTFAPPSLSFPPTPIGTTSSAKTATLTNLQTGSLTFTSVATSGDYAISNNTCVGSIASKGTCTISVTFTPTVKGAVSGALTVKDSATDSPEVVNLAGSGTGTVTNPVSFSPTSLTFSNQLVGTLSGGKTITLTNTGTTNLMVTGVTASGDYGETDTCAGQSIGHNGTCTITVKFTPSTTGTIKGEVSVADSAATSQQVVNLIGTGVGTLSFSPSTINFSIQDLNVPGTSQTATLTNNSGSAVSISNIAVSGEYTAPNTCGGSLAAHANCTFTVTFNPNRTGGINGAVTVTDTATNSPQVLSLSATSTNPPRYAFVLHENSLAIFSENPSTGQLRGNGYSLNNGAGFGSGQGITPSGKFFYTGLNGIGVYGFTVTASGGITPVPGSPFAADLGGCSPSNIVIDPANKFLYFSDVCTGVWAFTIGSNGALTSVAGSPFGSSSNRYSTLTISPSGKFLYNPLSDVGIYAYTINSTTGALTQVAGSPFDPSFGTMNLIVSPSGKFAYVSQEVGSQVAVFSINSSTGVLTEIAGSPFQGNAGVGPLAFDPGGKFLYASTTSSPFSSSAGINVLSVNATTGVPTPLPGTPFVTGINTTAVSIDPTGKFLFAVDINGNKAYTLSANPGTGALALLTAVRTNDLPIAILSNTGATPVTYTPKFAYATNQADKSISEYTISASTGALTAISGSPVADTNGPQAVAATPSQKFVYTANSNSSVSGYSVSTTTGALTKLSGSPFTGNSNSPVALAVEPTGNFLYTLNNGDKSVTVFSIAPNGTLTLQNILATGTNPRGMAMDPLSRYLYITNTADNTLSGFSIFNGSWGSLSLSTNTTGVAPMGAAIDPSGQFLYVANSGANTVSAYSISFIQNSVGGDLANVPGSPFNAGSTPVAVLAEPSGKFLYVANSGSSTISAYRIDNSTGLLTPISGTFTTGSSPDSLSVSNDGKFLYAANKSAGTVSIFTINSNGSLTAAGSAITGTAPTSIVTTGTIQ
jgi:6-phosphogluconolactonase (cycloisomerase 2 family)